MEGVEFYAMNTDPQALAACQVPNKLQLGRQDHQRAGRRDRTPKSAARRRSKIPTTSWRLLQGADMVFVTAGLGGGTGHRRRAGDRLARQGTGRPHRRGGDQAVRLRRAAPHAPGRRGHRPAGRHGGYRDRHSQRPPAGAGAARHQLLRGVQSCRRPAAPGGAGHQRHHHHARPDQPRLLRHQGHHGRDGLRHDGHGHRPRRKGGGGSGPPGHQLPAAGRLAHRRLARHSDQHHRLEPAWACTK